MPPIYIVVLEEGADVERVMSEIKSLGYRISRRLNYLNMLVIDGPEENIDKVTKIKGVKSVDKNRIIKPW